MASVADTHEKTTEEVAALAALVNIAENTELEPKRRIQAAELILRHEYSRASEE